jgi:hypothetical protein
MENEKRPQDRHWRKRWVAAAALFSALGSSTLANNENCANCLIPNHSSFNAVTSLQAPVMSAIGVMPIANFSNLKMTTLPAAVTPGLYRQGPSYVMSPEHQVAGIVNRSAMPYQSVIPRRAGPVVDPTDLPLPGQRDFSELDPTFHSPYKDWKAHHWTQWNVWSVSSPFEAAAPTPIVGFYPGYGRFSSHE